MKNLSRWLLLGLLVGFAGLLFSLHPSAPNAPSLARAQDSTFESKKIVPFVPTPQEVVDKMIELAGVKKGDTV